MTTTEPIVIPRDQLPLAWAQVDDNLQPETVSIPSAASDLKYRINPGASAAARKLAYEQLAVAEAIDSIIAGQAKEAEDKELDAEGLSLYKALHGITTIESWGKSDDFAKKHWRNVARAARELHGK